MSVEVLSWAAWSPGVEAADQWRQWVEAPVPLKREGAPAVRFVPALMRRRCDQLSRMVLEVLWRALGDCEPGSVASVFASRHGSFATMISMLEDLATDSPLSPNRFSHSVHNTQAGLFSICFKNYNVSTSIAARDETFAHGFLEAVSLINADPSRPVLLVTADEPIPADIAELSDREDGAYALALLLGPANGGDCVEVRVEAGAATNSAPHPSHPQALLFLRWLLSDSSTLRLPHRRRTWVWERRPE